jgi:hypothetical protein
MYSDELLIDAAPVFRPSGGRLWRANPDAGIDNHLGFDLTAA